jgi:hypothetical protein
MMIWHVRHLMAVALVALPAGDALAQGAASQAACFEVLAGPSEMQPAGAILLNRCSGETWILVRTYPSPARGTPAYRWSAIIADVADPKPPANSPAAATRDKCFTFQGRRFCE